MKFSKLHLFIALAVLLAISACGCTSQSTTLSGEERAQVLAYADPITDNLLQGYNEYNYTKYSRDFSSQTKNGINESAFAETRILIASKIGLYQSRADNPVVTESGDYISVNYKADFQQEQGVDVRLVFKKGDDSHQLYGLWFNSPKLRS